LLFTTGSYGRLEASKHSDIDLFFLFDNRESSFSRISKTLIDAHIISISREMRFPEFSADGEYLEVHNIWDLCAEMGSRKDDVEQLISLYFWFLDITQTDSCKLISWITNKSNRNIAFDKSREFSRVVFKLMLDSNNKDYLMYFLV